MRFLFQFPGIAFFDLGGVRLMLSVPEQPEFDHPASVIYYKADDIQAAWDELTSRHVETVAPPHVIAKMPDHDLWMAFFHDPDRNVLALMCEVARPQHQRHGRLRRDPTGTFPTAPIGTAKNVYAPKSAIWAPLFA